MIGRQALRSVCDEHGRLAVLALDHRDSLRVEFDADDPASVRVDDMVRFKLDVIAALGSQCSAIMVDPEMCIDPIQRAGRVPAGVGTIWALEAQGYLGDPNAVTNTLLAGWSPAQAKAVGASAAKLLLLYRPDRGSVTVAQDDLVRATVDACGQASLPLFVEPVPYDVVDAGDRERTVIGSAERLVALQPDAIKMPFPSDAATPDRWSAACAAVDEAMAATPWAVLSWGSPFDVFVRQVEAACAEGCSGFMAGRAIWAEAVHATDRAATLQRLAVPRLQALRQAIAAAQPILP